MHHRACIVASPAASKVNDILVCVKMWPAGVGKWMDISLQGCWDALECAETKSNKDRSRKEDIWGAAKGIEAV